MNTQLTITHHQLDNYGHGILGYQQFMNSCGYLLFTTIIINYYVKCYCQ